MLLFFLFFVFSFQISTNEQNVSFLLLLLLLFIFVFIDLYTNFVEVVMDVFRINCVHPPAEQKHLIF